MADNARPDLFTHKGRRFFEDADWDQEARRRSGTGTGTGSEWFVDSGVPAGGIHNIGDFYIDSDDYKVYKKTGAATWTYQGIIIKGADGSIWFSGAGNPIGTGVTGMAEGDFYLDSTTGDVYQYISSFWVGILNIVGTSGINGLNVYSGSGVPSSGLGIDGETYIDADNGDVYTKSSGAWSLTGNIAGPSGSSSLQVREIFVAVGNPLIDSSMAKINILTLVP